MREILFGGKRVDNGEWVYWNVYGELCRVNGKRTRLAIPKTAGESYYYYIYQIKHLIDKETVGQYTGLTDKNGKKIFEGDVYAWNDGEINEKTGKPYPDELSVVGFDNKKSAFVSKTLNGAYEFVYQTAKDNNSQYVGNIYDNPELLKGGATE